MTNDPNAYKDLEAFAQTLDPGAMGLTFRPAETRAPTKQGQSTAQQQKVALPSASIDLSRSSTSEETAVFVERMRRAETGGGPAGGAEAYEVIAPIGRGGMGEVWRAVQRSLDREIALKQLTTDDPISIEGFLSEARVTARLSHANIVPVHALGQSGDGRPMLAMKLVKGRSWLDLLREDTEGGSSKGGARRGVPASALKRHLEIFLSVCNAVAFAHAEGFLHRDLKPANVMVGELGQVFVVDWGLAVGLDREACEAHGILFVHDVESPAGTPSYMAPELALGDGASQGPATDVYLLGACLHEIVTGTPPHTAPSIAAALRHAVESARPEYDKSVPSELAEICCRAMACSPDERYPDVLSLRAAIETFIAHEAARALTQKGLRALARLGALSATHARAADKEESERAIQRTYTEARFAFELAEESWPEGKEAKRGSVEAARTMLEHALDTEDLPLATRLMDDAKDEELSARVEALREKITAKEAELLALREREELLDDNRIARPLGNVFLFAAVAGTLGALPTYHLLRTDPHHSAGAITVLWAVLTLSTGGYALFVLRGAAKSLISTRVGLTWAAVAAGCLWAGVVSVVQGERPFQNAAYATTMIGIGFVAHATHSKRWLFAGAVIAFIGAFFMALYPGYKLPLFSAVWLLSLLGVGFTLRRTAQQAPAPKKEPART